jgi:hypothetical protein
MVIFFEGLVGFNWEWVASQTFEQFYEHEKHHGLSKKQLKEVYQLCKVKSSEQE